MKLLTLFALAFTLSISPVAAQTDHYEGIKWKNRHTSHFVLRANGTDHEPGKKHAEDVYDLTVAILPGLKADFEEKKFRTPGGDDGGDGEQFHYTIYMTGDASTYLTMVQQEAGKGRTANNIRGMQVTGNYGDVYNQFYVLCKESIGGGDGENRRGGGKRDMTNVMIHSVGSQLVAGRARKSGLPLWMGAGYGYYCEHKLTKSCTVNYIDFSGYYEEAGNQITGGRLNSSDPWTKPLRTLCRKKIRENLAVITRATVDSMTPNISGYMFALTHFMVSTPERCKSYQKLVASARLGNQITEAELLSAYGYSTHSDFEKDWYEHIMSSKFR
jgi:hypothetical protein